MAFSPVLASKRITQQYKRYLSTIFQIADAEYQSQFTRELQKPSMYAAGPFLEVRSNFKTDKTLRQMISSCRLPRAFERLGFAMDRPLYAHQAQALGRIAAGRNLVVSTGRKRAGKHQQKAGHQRRPVHTHVFSFHRSG